MNNKTMNLVKKAVAAAGLAAIVAGCATMGSGLRSELPKSMTQGYDNRFSGEDILRFRVPASRITPEEANTFDGRFSAEDIVRITLKLRSAFGDDISRVWEDVRADVTLCDERFTGKDVVKLAESGEFYLPCVGAGEYPSRLSVDDILELRFRRVNPSSADMYTRRFAVKDVHFFVRSDGKVLVPAEEVAKYDGRFDARQISILYASGIDAETANGYDEEFDGNDVLELVTPYKVPHEFANGYCGEFDSSSIQALYQTKEVKRP